MIPGVSYMLVARSKGISIIPNVVPGKCEVVITFLSPDVNSISLLINVDFPTFVAPII